MEAAPGDYLLPYEKAARRHGAGFPALLWASPATQAARFGAITRLFEFHGARVLDAGCGRADLLDYWIERDVHPKHYVGLEAVEALHGAAAAKGHAGAQIVRGDFVREPARLLVGADVIVFSGSLNTLDRGQFYTTLELTISAAAKAVVFNFLCSPALAAVDWLTWHRAEQVIAHCRGMGHVETLSGYLDGDCTLGVYK